MPTLNDISAYFDTAPERSINIGAHKFIPNTKATANGFITLLRNNSGNSAFLPYWNQLVELYDTCRDMDATVSEMMNNG